MVDPLINDTAAAAPARRLHGALLSPFTLVLFACGTAAGLLFTATYLVEGVTRPGYSALADPVSLLSLGPGGWVQQVSFIAFGLVTLCCSVPALRLALAPGRGAIALPVLRAVDGAGLVAVGIFSQDPALGYPPGVAAVMSPTAHAEIHFVASFATITAIALGEFVLARRLAVEPDWGLGWAALAAITGVLTLVLITAFGAQVSHGGVAGLLERLATGVNSVMGVLLVGRLLLQAWRGAPDRQHGRVHP